MKTGSQASAVATARTPGYDVARALAVLGMVLVNYKLRTGANERSAGPLLWLSDRLDGRAAALFVVLAGLGIALRSRRARESPDEHLRFERRALLERALVLFVAGLVHLHLWDWDILHCYGLFLFVAAWLLDAPSWLLGLLALACTAIAQVLQLRFDFDATSDFFSATGMVESLFFNGLHPFFPWMSFLLVGMWLGRLDLGATRTRRRLILGALTAVAAGELLDTLAYRAPLWLGLDETTAALLSSWPKPPQPLFVLTAAATAIAAIALCVSVTRTRPEAGWVVALTATGQLAFTLYIAHAIAIEIPLSHGLLEKATLVESILYGFTFYGFAVAGSLWWRRRFPHGPLEAFIRQVTARRGPAPWGGALAKEGRPAREE